MASDGWIDVDNIPSKRQRLTEANDEVELVGIVCRTDKRENSSSPRRKRAQFNSPGPSSVEPAPEPLVERSPEKRETCRYGSSCYRRNEAHLMQYRHPLLEKAFDLMKRAGDFTKLPESFDVEDGDGAVLLEQAVILREEGFSPRMPISTTPRPYVSPVKSEPKVATIKSEPIPSTSKSSDPVRKLFEERRNHMKVKQEATQKIKEKQNTSQTCEGKVKITHSTNMAEKWEASCPFNFFLTKAKGVREEPVGIISVGFADLFHPSLGEVKALCHINFMVEPNWLFEQSMRAGLEGKPTRIIYGEDNTELEEGAKAFPSLKIFRAKSPFPYGHHHTKMSLAQYTDGSVRFFVYTSNLIESDWDNRTQGIWISPKCPKMNSDSPPGAKEGESPTKFRADIIQYLSTYPVQIAGAWMHIIKFIDCSNIKVYFVGSAPITAKSNFNGFQFGIKKVEKVLRSHEMETEPNWSLTAQCSSIGTLGASSSDWLVSELGAAMAGKDRTLIGPLNLVYPSNNNVKGSFDGVMGGGCLPYSAMTHLKQKWLNRHFRQWQADCSKRTRVPPHIKSYSRWSPDQSKMAWFLLTSANVSKAAWGSLTKKGDRLTIMSWEAGVLFVPELFGSSKYFTVRDEPDSDALKFPLYFDTPLVPYDQGDYPWFFETLKLALSE